MNFLAAQELKIEHYLGITASVDTFYEGQERTNSANPYLILSLERITEEYRRLNIFNYEMESGMLFKMAGVYNFVAAAVCCHCSTYHVRKYYLINKGFSYQQCNFNRHSRSYKFPVRSNTYLTLFP